MDILTVTGYKSITVQSFAPGTAKERIEELRRAGLGEAALLTEGELYFMQMDFRAAGADLAQLLDSEDLALRSYALRLYSINAIFLGDAAAFHSAAQQLADMPEDGPDGAYIRLSKRAFYSTLQEKDFRLNRILSGESHVFDGMDLGHRMFGFYSLIISDAHEYQIKEWLKMIATMFALCPSPMYPVIQGYLYVYCACAYHALGYLDDMAEHCIRNAVDLLRPDGMIYPFLAYTTYMSNPLVEVLAGYWPEAAEEVRMRGMKVCSLRTEAHNRISPKKLPTNLTRREHEVAALAAHGLSNKEIAAKLDLSPFTVRTILSNVFNKLGINNRKDLEGLVFAPHA